MKFCKDNMVCKWFAKENEVYGNNFKVFNGDCGNCVFADFKKLMDKAIYEYLDQRGIEVTPDDI